MLLNILVLNGFLLPALFFIQLQDLLDAYVSLRPIMLSVTLPFLGEPSPKSAFPYHVFSPRIVLAKDYTQILKQVDGLWIKVGLQLHNFGESVNEAVVLSGGYIFEILNVFMICYNWYFIIFDSPAE